MTLYDLVILFSCVTKKKKKGKEKSFHYTFFGIQMP